MRTPLYDAHLRLGAKMVDFAGWEMPVQYTGILDEHRATRFGAGVFDVSHMGELWLSGDGCFDYLQKLLTHDMKRLTEGKWVYSPMCDPNGGTVDDVIVYPMDGGYLICVNASNADKDFEWVKEHTPSGVTVENHSVRYAQIAVQGPLAKELCEKVDLSKVILNSPTGYTGERGRELYLPPEHSEKLWEQLIEAGGTPCGLGARDTLRLEAALPLYGHELSNEISPWEAGLHRFICFDKGDFVGRDALLEQKNDPEGRKLIGLKLNGRGIPRHGYPVIVDGENRGFVTSGGVAPTVGGQIAMALVDGGCGVGDSMTNTDVSVEIRGKQEQAEITALPFYKR